MKRLFPFVCSLSCLIAAHSFAGSATWNLNPVSGDWNTVANWTPATVPNGSSDTATFDLSNTADISLSASVQLSGLVFNSAASAYTLTVPTGTSLVISGLTGITNNSGVVQEFLADKGSSAGGLIQFTGGNAGALTHFDILGASIPTSKLEFFNSSTAGSAAIDLEGSSVRNTDGGILNFNDLSSAGSATIVAHAATAAQGGISTLSFFDTSTAGTATITGEGGATRNASGALLVFHETSKAGTSLITVNGSQTAGAFHSVLFFDGTASADHATLTANSGVDDGGEIAFMGSSPGSSAQIRLLGKGNLDISGSTLSSVTIGSLEGDGLVFLGAKILSIGNISVDTVFSGII
jgi:hypothetical protein